MSAMADKTWSVVQFEDSSVEAVPTNWIQGDICHWPSMAHPKLMSAIRKSEPLNTCWPTHKIKVFRNATFDDYMKARLKARTAEETSDLASEFEQSGTKRRRIQKVLSSSEDSIEESILPSPPKKPIVIAINERSESNTVNVNGEEQQENQSMVNLTTNNLHSSVLSESNIATHNQEDFCCRGCQQNANKLKIVIEQNHMLRSLVTDMLLEVRQQRAMNNNEMTHSEESLFTKYNLSFPLNSQEDFLKFDELLYIDTNFNEAVNELARIGGSNNYNMVKRILTSLLTNEAAMKYSWLGRKGKKAFHEMKVSQLIISSVEKADMSKTRKETEQSIQAWLKRAKERKDGNSTKKF